MSVTKAITIDQPYATLAKIGVKGWETDRPLPFLGLGPKGVRGYPGCRVTPGERLAIHASLRKHDVTEIGLVPWLPLIADPDTYTLKEPLQFGAVLCTFLPGRVLPVYEADRLDVEGLPVEWQNHIVFDSDAGTLTVFTAVGRNCVKFWHDCDISDQIPYGRWRHGTWATEILDVEVLPEPVPCKGSQGVWELARMGVTL